MALCDMSWDGCYYKNSQRETIHFKFLCIKRCALHVSYSNIHSSKSTPIVVENERARAAVDNRVAGGERHRLPRALRLLARCIKVQLYQSAHIKATRSTKGYLHKIRYVLFRFLLGTVFRFTACSEKQISAVSVPKVRRVSHQDVE